MEIVLNAKGLGKENKVSLKGNDLIKIKTQERKGKRIGPTPGISSYFASILDICFLFVFCYFLLTL
jgi:hypothetical protein